VCFLKQAVKGTPVRQIVRLPEVEPGKVLNNVQVGLNEGSVKKKISELVDDVRLILSCSSAWGCSHCLMKHLFCSTFRIIFNIRQK
jgi:hypothetical protein